MENIINEKLIKWQEKFDNARSLFNDTLMSEREEIYLGSRVIDQNVNNTNRPTKKANNVVNITYELIETMVDSVIPHPAVKSKKPEDEENAMMIEQTLQNYLDELNINKVNDYCERITSIQGYSLMEIDWNSDKTTHNKNGDICIRTIHPKQLIPQPGVWELEEMDYFFVASSVTKKYIKRRYDKDVVEDSEEYPEYNTIGRTFNNTNSIENEKVTEIVAWYRDEDGDIGKYVFINNQELEDLPKYYKRKLKKCTKCGEYESACECKKPKFEIQNQDFEISEEEITLTTGEVLPVGTKMPHYVPKTYPIVMRINVPQSFNLGGQSDVDIIRDQQDSIKKIVTTIEEKIVRGGAIIKALDTHNVNLSNQLYQIVKGNPQELNALQIMNLEASIAQDLQVAQFMYTSAKSVLGVTDSFQGKQDTTAKSGVAKQIQVQQSTGRLQSRSFNKYEAYRNIFKRMFELLIAFADELRPYSFKDEENQTVYSVFDRYRLLSMDKKGELYYNTDYLFYSDAGQGLPRDKMFILDKALQLYQLQIFDADMVMQILIDLQFPNAVRFKAKADKQKEMMMAQQQEQMAQEQQVAGQEQMTQGQPSPMEETMANLPPEQQQMVKDWLQSLSPQDQANMENVSEEELLGIIQNIIGQQ